MNRRHYRLLLLAATLLGACTRGDEGQTNQGQPRWSFRVGPDSAVAARVAGQPIPVAQVEAIARQSGLGSSDALARAIDEELLVHEALKRQLYARQEVAQAERRALANRLLEKRWVEGFKKSDIARAELRKAYELNRGRFDRPALVKVSHILAAADAKASPQQRERALSAARRARRLALEGTLTPKGFRQLRRAIARDYPKLRIKAESLVTPRKGRVVEPFAAAAFDLAQKGDISGVVATRFGYHVIYLEDRKEAIHKSLEQAADEIRERIFDDVRKQKVERLLARLREKTPIERYPERLPGTSESR